MEAVQLRSGSGVFPRIRLIVIVVFIVDLVNYLVRFSATVVGKVVVVSS